MLINIMSYLENDICKFTPLFKIDYNVKINIMSACLFKMENSGYKDFSIYLKGLDKLNSQVELTSNVDKLRLFIDKSIYDDKNIYDKIRKLKNIQLVLYHCPNYILKDKYHIGIFGMFARFFPFFDFPNNDANNVILSDIDITNNDLKWTIIPNMNKLKETIGPDFNNIYLFKTGDIGKSMFVDNKLFYKNKLNNYVYTQFIASLKRINKEVLIDFLTKLNTDDDYTQHIQHYISAKKLIEEQKTDDIITELNINKYSASHKNFIYGVDEYFINNVLFEYAIDNKLRYAVCLEFNVIKCFYLLFHYLDYFYISKNNNKILNNALNYIYKELNYKINDNLTIDQKFKNLDEKIYFAKSSTEQEKYNIFKAFYKFLLYSKNKPEYDFIYPNDIHKLFVNNKYFGTYYINFFRIINYDKPDKDIILDYLKLNKKDIKKIKS